MFGLGVGELLIIGAIIVLLFGAKRIPELAKGLGQGLKVFKKELNSELENKESDEADPEKIK